MSSNLVYPSCTEFAFTILDDTDDTTIVNGRPVYDFLQELGMLTTKTVWAFDTPKENRGPYFAGETLSSPEYLQWVHELSTCGFEIAFHNATMGSSVREDTIKALDFIEKEFESPVRLHCNHGQNKENLFWGIDRYSAYPLNKLFHLLSLFRSYPRFEGNNSKSPYFWSDIAEKRLAYIRAFAFKQLNGMRIPPGRIYRDTSKLSAPIFFNTADAPDVKAFNELVNPASIDRLRKQKGWAIVSTHFGKGFYQNGKLDPEFEKTMRYLASLEGWFVPVSQLLDFLKNETGAKVLSKHSRLWMEYSHILDRIKGLLI